MSKKLLNDIQVVNKNIKLNSNLLNKYDNVKEIFKYENIKEMLVLNTSITNVLNQYDLKKIKINELKILANNIFEKNHTRNTFVNNNSYIIISKTGINESVNKIYNNYSQRELLIEHLVVFANLGKIIEHAILVNQAKEIKGRKKYKSWNYYLDKTVINKKIYKVVFDVVSMDNGQNLYRIQRINLL